VTFLNRDELLKPLQIPIEKVPLPEWGNGHHVYVRGWTTAERSEFDTMPHMGLRQRSIP